MSLANFKLPPTLLIIAGVLLLATIASELLPSGKYERVELLIPANGVQWVEHKMEAGETLEATVDRLRREQADKLAANSSRKPEQYLELIESMTGDAEPRLAESGGSITGEPAPGTVIEVPLIKTGSRKVVRPGTYVEEPRPEAGDPLKIVGTIAGRFFMAPLEGFVKKAEIIGFVLLIGGAFGIILGTGAIDAGLRATVGFMEARRAGWLLIPVVMTMFSIAGATFGMSEEVIPFVMITIPLALRLGYDSLTGLCLSFVAAGIGFAAALTNPFTIGIAQGIAGIAPFSGFQYRLVIWFLATGIGIVFTMRWAAKVKRKPQSSPVFESDKDLAKVFDTSVEHQQGFGVRDGLVLLVLTAAVVAGGLGSTLYEWWLGEITAVFLVAAVASWLLSGMTMEKAAAAFNKGAGELTGASIIIALSSGILVVLEQGQTLDTILHYIDESLGDMPGVMGANVMYIFHMILNFFIPSGSGQASVTMPLMSPLADLMGISRQTAVLAFQFGDGFNNMIIPTSAVTMSVLGIARLPWEKWARWILPLQLIFIGFSFIMLTIAVLIGFE